MSIRDTGFEYSGNFFLVFFFVVDTGGAVHVDAITTGTAGSAASKESNSTP